ncbi:MAG: hypothetical protein KAJ51_01210 [Thermoplasmata archaeon]|nr:hypothetical protein [Thermoplasmata archaeon]
MAEYEIGKIKMGGMFSTERVGFMIKFESPLPNGEKKTISMFHEKDGRPLGRLEYSKSNTTSKLNTFVIQDWSSIKYAEGLLTKFLTSMKKQGVKMIDHELYDTDDKTHQKLRLFKRFGFEVENRGNITGYNQYYMKLQLR